MKQQTLAMTVDQNSQYEQYRRPTKRDMFLATMERIVPWAALCAAIEPRSGPANLNSVISGKLAL